MTDRKALKAAAKARLAQAGPRYLKVMLLYALAGYAVPQVLALAAGPSTGVTEVMDQLSRLLESGIEPGLALELLQLPGQRLLLQFMLSVVLSVYQTIVSFGMVVYTLRLSRGQECGAPELFSGFSMAGRVVGQWLVLLGLYMLLAIGLSIPLAVILTLGLLSGSEVVAAVLTGAAALAYAAALFAVMLRYSLAALALADRPELGVMGSIRYGKALIQGHIGEYFVLLLSFFGWIMLCSAPTAIFSYVCASGAVSPWLEAAVLLVLSLPMYLWLTPYMNTTIAGFYDALQQRQGEAPYPTIRF